MVEMFELVNHRKRFLTASAELGRFSSKGMATSATGDLAVSLLIQDAGASDSTVAGGDHIIIADMASSLLRPSVGRRSHAVALEALQAIPARSAILQNCLGANAITQPQRSKACFNSIR
jgi:hypothetical protein